MGREGRRACLPRQWQEGSSLLNCLLLLAKFLGLQDDPEASLGAETHRSSVGALATMEEGQAEEIGTLQEAGSGPQEFD